MILLRVESSFFSLNSFILTVFSLLALVMVVILRHRRQTLILDSFMWILKWRYKRRSFLFIQRLIQGKRSIINGSAPMIKAFIV